jgi:hypothetical protein
MNVRFIWLRDVIWVFGALVYFLLFVLFDEPVEVVQNIAGVRTVPDIERRRSEPGLEIVE